MTKKERYNLTNEDKMLLLSVLPQCSVWSTKNNDWTLMRHIDYLVHKNQPACLPARNPMPSARLLSAFAKLRQT